MNQPIKFKIDVCYLFNGEMQGADEATQLQYINRLRLYVPVLFSSLADEYGGSYGPVRWDTMQEDLSSFTLLYPDIILAVYYDGPEVEMGVQYFHRGRFYFAEAQVVYPKFDLGVLPATPPLVQVVVYDGTFAGVLGLPPGYIVSSIALDSDSGDEYYMCRMKDKMAILCSHHAGQQVTDPSSSLSEIVYGPFEFGPCQLCPH
jgi:hypothetical protein